MKKRTFVNIITPLVKLLWPTVIFNSNYYVPNEKKIYVCNHYSAMDTNVFVAYIFKQDFNCVVKDEVFKNKTFKKFLEWVGCISIKRGENDIDSVKKILKVLKNNKPLMLFPEGTRNKEENKEMLEFKDGAVVFALKSKSMIVPMVYYRKQKVFRKNYVMIGEPIDLNKFLTQSVNDVKKDATIFLYEEMAKLQKKLTDLIEGDKTIRKEEIKKAKKMLKITNKKEKIEYKLTKSKQKEISNENNNR